MATTDVPRGAVAVGVDGSMSSDQALDWAADQAALEHRPLLLLHATGATHGLAALRDKRRREVSLLDLRLHGQELLYRGVSRAVRRHRAIETHTRLVSEDPGPALLHLAGDARLVVLGSRGRGPLRSLLLGSVGVEVVRHCPCPAVVVRPHHSGLVRRGVLVGTDAGTRSRPTLEFAYAQASLRQLPLTVVHCTWDVVTTSVANYVVPPVGVSPEDAQILLAEAVSGLAEKYPDVRVTLEVAHGLPDSGLLHASESSDLLVVGRHQFDAMSHVLTGSAAERIVEHATCVVAVVPE